MVESRNAFPADRRPRIHIWPAGTGAAYSFGPCGVRIVKPSIGGAVEDALAEVRNQPAVIIYEGASHVRS